MDRTFFSWARQTALMSVPSEPSGHTPKAKTTDSIGNARHAGHCVGTALNSHQSKIAHVLGLDQGQESTLPGSGPLPGPVSGSPQASQEPPPGSALLCGRTGATTGSLGSYLLGAPSLLSFWEGVLLDKTAQSVPETLLLDTMPFFCPQVSEGKLARPQACSFLTFLFSRQLFICESLSQELFNLQSECAFPTFLGVSSLWLLLADTGQVSCLPAVGWGRQQPWLWGAGSLVWGWCLLTIAPGNPFGPSHFGSERAVCASVSQLEVLQ